MPGIASDAARERHAELRRLLEKSPEHSMRGQAAWLRQHYPAHPLVKSRSERALAQDIYRARWDKGES